MPPERLRARSREPLRAGRKTMTTGTAAGRRLKPIAAWDDGVRTWIQFGARSELPAIFVENDDGTESLVNFSVSQGDIVVQRVARRFVLRRGRLTGCIVNKAFTGGGERLKSHTVSPGR